MNARIVVTVGRFQQRKRDLCYNQAGYQRVCTTSKEISLPRTWDKVFSGARQ